MSARSVQSVLSTLAAQPRSPRYDRPAFHPFPARMPVWLAQQIIEALTRPGESVLDPMVGSGTTAIAALHAGRRVIGTDLDPMALLLARVGTRAIKSETAHAKLASVADRAGRRLDRGLRVGTARDAFDREEQEFLRYWFPPRSQKELYALSLEIKAMPPGKYRDLAWVVLSGLIIAKSAGASYALDISRSRPHKVEEKPVINPLEAWEARCKSVVHRLPFTVSRPRDAGVEIRRADARKLPVQDQTIDLVITSPPYLNAIDYMRSHKFALMWMEHSLAGLRDLRGTMIGTERGMYSPDSLPSALERSIVSGIDKSDRLGQVRRYLSDMRRVLIEIERVLRPGGSVVMALGPHVISISDPDSGDVVGELAQAVGLDKVGAVFRQLDKTRRSLPPPFAVRRSNPLRRRMAGEVFLGLRKRR